MQYKILDLFAGAGGLSLGFEMTKLFSVAAIVENNKNASKTYINNHPGLKNYDDILTVNFNKLLKDTGEIDVVIGGPPCQGFSNANRQRRHLINGSNELVKRYVKAIEEINPKIFVMENVKTIASDKHSFCLTTDDKEFVEKTLKLQIHEKEVVLYEGKDVNDVYTLYVNHKNDINCVNLMDEEQLYCIYNIYKKRDKLETYFSRESNIKKVKEIIDIMSEKEDFPDWYNLYTRKAKIALKKLIDTKGECIKSMNDILSFWNVQRFYQGICELVNKKAIFNVVTDNQSIKIRMRTYIVIDYIRNAFKNLGYTINEGVLNAATFGVPQTRERFILIGVKNTLNVPEEKVTLPEPIIEDPSDYITVNEAIKDLQEYMPSTGDMNIDMVRSKSITKDTYYRSLVLNENNGNIYNHVCTDSRPAAIERFKQIRQGDNFHSLPAELKSTYEDPTRTQNTIYRRLDPNKPSETVVNVRKSMWIHPELDRAVSAREAARLQSFPDSYKFYGTKDSVYQQIGNAVPPLLGRAIAEKVLEILGNKDSYITLKHVYENCKRK